MPARLHVDLLGPPAVRLDDAPVAFDTRKAVAVLAVLAVALADGTGPVARDHLAAMLWPDADDARARGGLRRTLSVLVAGTGEAVLADRHTVRLRADAVTADVVRFRALARSTDREALAEAVELVRGDLLAGFALRDCLPFEEWTATTSAALRRDLGAALERLVLARVRHGELHAALTDAVRWLELDPLHEPAHRAVMRLSAWTGRRQEALDQYRRCVRVLADELGVAPVRATTEVFEAIRGGTLAPPKRGRPSAPPAPVEQAGLPMVGRDTALAALRDAAGVPGRLVLVTGEAGVGRSRLIEEFAARTGPVLLARAHEGEAGLSYAPVTDLLRLAVARIDPLDADLAVELSRVLPGLLPPGRDPAPPLDSPGARDRFFEAVARALAAAGAAAVVVEDVHAAGPAAADVLAYLLHRLDRLRSPVVMTWRDPGLPPRHAVRTALATGRLSAATVTVALDRLSRADVAELLAAAGSDLDVDLVHAESAGLPMLLVEAVRTGRHDVLTVPTRDLLAARLDGVSEETGQVLAALAVCGGSADPALLRSISGRGDVETVDAVEEALRAGLAREEGSGVAFTHDALRRVAHDRLSLVRRRLLHGRAAEALMATPDTGVRAGAIARHWHEAGRDDEAAAWAWTAAVRAAELFAHEEAVTNLEFVSALGGERVETALLRGDALVAMGRYEPALVALEHAASLAASADAPLRARIERRAADIHGRLGDWDLADAGLAAGLALLDGTQPDGARIHGAQPDGPQLDEGRIDGPSAVELRAELTADRAVVALRSGRPDGGRHTDAARYADAARAMGTGAYVHNVAGLVALAGGDAAHARDEFALALGAAPSLVLRAAVLNNLARAQAAVGESTEAVDSARAALALGETHGDRHRLAALHTNLADRLHDTGATEEAIEHVKTSATLFAEIGADPLHRPEVWMLVGW